MKNKMIKYFAFFAILCLLCPLISLSARASEPEDNMAANVLDIKTTYGFNNCTKSSRNTPVFFDIDNHGPAISGTLRLSYTGSDGIKKSYSNTFSMTSGSSDVFVITSEFIPSYTKVLVEVYDSSDRLVYSKNELTLNKNTNDIYAGIISDHWEQMEYLKNIVFYSEDFACYYAMRTTDLTSLPALEDAGSLNQLDLIFLGSYDLAKLSSRQKNALKEWVYDGGTLITGPASQYKQLWRVFNISPLYMNVLPQHISTDFDMSGLVYSFLKMPLSDESLESSPTDQDISSARNSTMSALSVDNKIFEESSVNIDFYRNDEENAAVGNSFEDDKYLQRAAYGKGHILSLHFNYDTEPYTSWSGASPALQQIISSQFSYAKIIRFFGDDISTSYYTAQSLLPTGVSVASFSLAKYIVIFIIYIAIIGPAAYVVLKKLDKRHWLWVIVPVLSLGFFVIVYTLSSNTRKSEPFLNEVTMMNYNDTSVREEVYFSTVFPKKGPYTLEIPDIYRLRYFNFGDILHYDARLPFFSFSEQLNRSENYDISYETGENEYGIKLNNSAAFSEWYFNGTRQYRTSKNVFVTVESSGGTYTVDVVNHTENDFDYSGIFVADKIICTGQLKAGESIHLDHIDLDDYDDHTKNSREYESINRLLNISSQENIDPRENQLQSLVMYEKRQFGSDNRQVYFVGISTDHQSEALRYSDWEKSGVLITSKTAKIDFLPDNDEIIIPDANALLYKAENLYDMTFFYADETEIQYRLPGNMCLTEISARAPENVRILVYNQTLGQYDSIDELKKDDEKALSAYVDDAILKIKFTRENPNFDYETLMPAISLKGVVQK